MASRGDTGPRTRSWCRCCAPSGPASADAPAPPWTRPARPPRTTSTKARKASKRARYVAESLTEVLGRRAGRLAKTAKGVQRALGDHQDRVLVHEFLVDAPPSLDLAGEEARVLAGVRDAQAVALEAAREDLRRVLRDVDRTSLRAWMR